ncbi:MAG: glucokinase [Limnobacter sp.]|nr:glucokinase [Limnobacter sp.]
MSQSAYHLVGDVGGTHARLALLQGDSNQLVSIETRHCADFPSLQAAIHHYLEGQQVAHLESACLALACPVNADRIQFTNNPWSFSREELRTEFNLKAIRLVNDFTAMALGMLHVPQDQLLSLTPQLQWTREVRAVIGPGTGLGFSALIPSQSDWQALSTEGGHVAFAPRDELELEILRILMKRHNNRVSAERVLCGQGLVNIYSALAEIHRLDAVYSTPAEITQGAMKGDGLAKQALNRFCNMLGDYAGDMVLALGAMGGVYLCGGILPRIQDQFLASDFMAHFTNKGRFTEYLAGVPVALSLAEQPGLMGAAVALRRCPD